MLSQIVGSQRSRHTGPQKWHFWQSSFDRAANKRANDQITRTGTNSNRETNLCCLPISKKKKTPKISFVCKSLLLVVSSHGGPERFLHSSAGFALIFACKHAGTIPFHLHKVGILNEPLIWHEKSFQNEKKILTWCKRRKVQNCSKRYPHVPLISYLHR